MILMTVVIKRGVGTIRRVVRNAPHPVGHVSLAASLRSNNAQTHIPTASPARPTRSFSRHQKSLASIIYRTGHINLWCWSMRRDFFCLAQTCTWESKGDWCVSAPHVLQLWHTLHFLTHAKCRPRACFQRHSCKKGKNSEETVAGCFTTLTGLFFPGFRPQLWGCFPHLVTPTSLSDKPHHPCSHLPAYNSFFC